jgi:hypothetical protein
MNMNIKGLNLVLVLVIIVLVIFCLLRNEHFQSGTTTCGTAKKDPYVEMSPFHPGKEETELDTNNYIYGMNNTDNHKVYGLGSDMSKWKNVAPTISSK